MSKRALLHEALKLLQGATYSQLPRLRERYFAMRPLYPRSFLRFEPRKRVQILDETLFFQFLSDEVGFVVSSFEEIVQALEPASRGEAVARNRESKWGSISPFSQGMWLRKRGEPFARFYTDEPEEEIGRVVAVENGESFLRIASLQELFDAHWFLYLGGFGNRLVRSFLAQREVICFLDWDIGGMNIYESLPAQQKWLFVPDNIEELFQRYGNPKLYFKQRSLLRESYSPEAQSNSARST